MRIFAARQGDNAGSSSSPFAVTPTGSGPEADPIESSEAAARPTRKPASPHPRRYYLADSATLKLLLKRRR
jgi:hypothetical protein